MYKTDSAGSKVVNFNNGVPNEEQQHQIKNDVLKKAYRFKR